MKENYLPLGSVIKLKNSNKSLMIIGYGLCTKNKDDKKYYDYSVCTWPEGTIELDKMILCNQEDIETVIFEGYKNEESNKWIETITPALNNLKNNKKNIIEEKNDSSTNNQLETSNIQNTNPTNSDSIEKNEESANLSIKDSSKSIINNEEVSNLEQDEPTVSIVE
ncbi:MAG: DUF4176 domain-containing protein [Bacilli bacterium]|nr:DUF4176 domain-containing protein [Bacilli bacterium]